MNTVSKGGLIRQKVVFKLYKGGFMTVFRWFFPCLKVVRNSLKVAYNGQKVVLRAEKSFVYSIFDTLKYN